MLTDVDGYVQQVLQEILSSCEGTVSVRPITSLTPIFHLISAQRPRGVNAIKGILEFGNLWSVPLIFVVMWQQHGCGSTCLPLCEPMSARRLEKMESESKYNKKVSIIQHHQWMWDERGRWLTERLVPKKWPVCKNQLLPCFISNLKKADVWTFRTNWKCFHLEVDGWDFRTEILSHLVLLCQV